MRHLIAIASVVAVVQGLAGRVPLAQKPTLFSRGSYFAQRAREDAARAVRRALFGDQLSQLQVGGHGWSIVRMVPSRLPLLRELLKH